MRISDWSSDVCSSDLYAGYVLSYALLQAMQTGFVAHPLGWDWLASSPQLFGRAAIAISVVLACLFADCFMQLKRYAPGWRRAVLALAIAVRSEVRRVGKMGVRSWRSRGSTDT